MGTVFCVGLFLGYVRLKTGSLPLCILMHMLANLVSTIETEILIASDPD